MTMLSGKFTDKQYLEQLLYRHFVFLAPRLDAVLINETRISGRSGRIDDNRQAILRKVIQAAWGRGLNVPLIFDPYFALSPTIQSMEVKDGWLNVYERYGA